MIQEYADVVSRVFNGIGNKRLISLATGNASNITCRTMTCVIFNQKFYFQTDKNSVKAVQLSKNSRAAISFEKYQIIGVCSRLGHPFDKNNKHILALMKECFPSAVEKYSYLDQEVLYEFLPEIIKVWEYTETGAVIVTIHITEKNIYYNRLGY